jgi:hypothetical protein
MQKKFPYSVLKWTLVLGVASSLATACVVTSGDGSDLGDGGEGNNNTGNVGNEAGETSNGGSSSAGKGGTGGSATAGSSTAGSTAAGGDGGSGSTAYVPGQCMDQAPTPSSEPSCDTSTGNQAECSKCLKTNACALYKECYGTAPTTACGYGPVEGDGGQFQCILNCFAENKNDLTDPDDLFLECGTSCALQCDAADGAIMGVTNDLADAAYKKCNAECFPFN